MRIDTNKKKLDLTPYLLLTPSLLLIVCVMLFPIGYAAYTSMHQYVLWDIANRKFVGLGNYAAAWSDPSFLISLGNTAKWVFVTVACQLAVGLALALLLNMRFRGRGLLRSVTLIPWVTPGVVIAIMWSLIYNGNFGVLNDILRRLGILRANVAWLATSSTALNAEIVTMVWQGIPFFTIMILSSLQSIPEDLYEVAVVSGATPWQKFRYITWPFILPTISITCLLRFIWVANNVEIIYLMTGGGPGYSSLTLSVNAYIMAQKILDFGYGSTLAMYGTILMIVFMIFYLRLSGRYGGGIGK